MIPHLSRLRPRGIDEKETREVFPDQSPARTRIYHSDQGKGDIP